MIKNSFKILIMLVILLIIPQVNALSATSSELLNRNVCSDYELALANSDGSLTSVSCYSTYPLAKEAMDISTENTAVILERVNSRTRVIDAKYALVYLNQSSNNTVDVYLNNKLSTSLTYMNNSSYFGGTDAAFLGFDYNYRSIKVKISGLTGWLSNKTYLHNIIPLSWVKSSSYYKVTNSDINHYYAGNIQVGGYSQMYYALGPKNNSSLENIDNGNYYSYDGIYFYKTLEDMLNDYRNGNYDLSINKDSPYYNYYMYLPHRTKTNYNVDDLDNYIRYDLKFVGSIYGKKYVSGYSSLYGTGDYFMNAEKLYGANAISVFGISMNESAKGTSSIAASKNNIFGHQAYDNNPFANATGYLDVRSSIYYHAYSYINYGYSEISDYRYYGGHFGNKKAGMNVMYASDVYWGEKASSYYYSFDKDGGLLDYNYYQLIMSTTGSINARLEPNTSSSSPYMIPSSNMPYVLLEEVTGESVRGNNIWYKIQSDSNLSSTGSVVNASSNLPQYNWQSYVYVHSSYFIKINNIESVDGKYNYPIDTIKGDTNNYTYTTYATKTNYTPKVGKATSDIDYYYSSSLINKKGSIKENSFITILEEARNDDELCYLVITNYQTYQKHWISSENITLVDKDLMDVNLTTSGSYITAYDKPNGADVAHIYTDNQLPIVDMIDESDNLYLKVQYTIENSIQYAYVDVETSGITYTTNYLNRAPIINATDITLMINSSYNLLLYATGSDYEDGDITDNILISSHNIDITKEGSYTATYSLTDTFGDTVTKTINVNVKLPEKMNGLFMYNSLLHKENNVFTISGFMGVKGIDNKYVYHTLIFINQETGIEYAFSLDNWMDYPYEMSSLDDKKTYDYSGGWFKSDLDLSSTNLPNGDYTIYVKVTNNNYEATSLFTNIAYMDMARRVVGLNREFLIDVDYGTLNSPILFSVRDQLISSSIPTTMDPMYNFFNTIGLDNSLLSLKGTSHNIGVNMGIDDNVERFLIFENTTSFTRYTFSLGSIIDGDYPITLALSDNCDKTRAWYDSVIDLSSILPGQYALYVSNKVNDITYYGELIDIAYTDFTSINNAKYTFARNDNKRLRLELTVNE